uniref:Ion transport domain-containing protein n=1 Tax=Trichobilharzia regenti TaxID=157069 RepID=A0AA85JV50_TRIRE|nr:unnamed protein product [Trichobilharzia regenti]
MRSHYLNSSRFYIDCLSLLPLDFLYLSIGYKSILRIFRLCKVYKFWQFMDRAERHANYPNLMRSTKLLLYYLTFLHWNACIFQLFNSTAESVFMLTVTPNSPNSGGATTTASTSTQTTSLGTGSHISHNTTSGSTNNRANNSNHSTVQNNHHGNLTTVA